MDALDGAPSIGLTKYGYVIVAFDEVFGIDFRYTAKDRGFRSGKFANANCGMCVFAVRGVGDPLANGVELCILVAKQNIARTKFIDVNHLHFVLCIEFKSRASNIRE
ncbi:hypothetical protein DO65_1112 [Burkholderia pseudomallei]|nr:hypothetical protein DO65_1112 [Burkholderia pseudomallei]